MSERVIPKPGVIEIYLERHPAQTSLHMHSQWFQLVPIIYRLCQNTLLTMSLLRCSLDIQYMPRLIGGQWGNPKHPDRLDFLRSSAWKLAEQSRDLMEPFNNFLNEHGVANQLVGADIGAPLRADQKASLGTQTGLPNVAARTVELLLPFNLSREQHMNLAASLQHPFSRTSALPWDHSYNRNNP